MTHRECSPAARACATVGQQRSQTRGHRLCLALRPRQRNEFVVKALAAVALVR
jgi:hypothetical protein